MQKKSFIKIYVGLILSAVSSVAVGKPYIDFSDFDAPSRPNYYLMCPEQVTPKCSVEPHEASPVFDVPAHVLIKLWREVIDHRQRVTLMTSYPLRWQYHYKETSLIFRLPAEIVVQFVENTAKKSSVIIFSRSKYGYTDFGVNQERTHEWLRLVGQRVDWHLRESAEA